MTQPQYIISGDLNITLIMKDGNSRSIGKSHPNHGRILDAIRTFDWEAIPGLVDIPQAISNFSSGRVVVNACGEVTYNGQLIHNTITERISEFMRHQLPFEPLVRFLENLMANPSRRAVDELYNFLENEGMAITEDGCFVGYKGVRDDYKDCHTGTFDNSPGQVLEMARNLVDDDARRGCSNGFHVGSQKYAAGFGMRTMLVKVNPADAVSVPYAEAEKLRVCRYEVLKEVENIFVVQEPMYADDDWESDGYDYADEDEAYDDQEEEPETGRVRGPGGRFLPNSC